MKVSAEILARLNEVSWFSRCGLTEPVETALATKQVVAWSDAEKCFSDSSWEEIGSDAQGDLTEHLSSRHPDKYQGRWNKIVKEAREVVKQSVMSQAQTFQSEQGIAGVFTDCVQWDVLHAVMTLVYSDCQPPPFLLELLKVYEAGHYPCGWDGDWPNGTLLYI